ncbi:MAG: cyclase family protein [Actinomycetota bacterium]
MAIPDDFRALAEKINNWGRWGDDDEIGTLNLITDEVVRRAAACVKTGKRFSLAIPMSEDGPMLGNIPPGRKNPKQHRFELHDPFTKDPDSAHVNTNEYTLNLKSATHWSALGHVEYGGRLYNGHPTTSIDERGAHVLGIDKVGSIVTRGVLLDVARLKGVDSLAGGTVISPDDLDAASKVTGLAVEPGDAVLIRTGAMRWLKEGDKESYAGIFQGIAGPGIASAAWFRDHDVAAVAVDTSGFEVWPRESKDLLKVLGHPLHLLCIVEMGLTLGQNFDLESLAEDCASDGVYEFLLTASPEPFGGGLGGPVNPVAIK